MNKASGKECPCKSLGLHVELFGLLEQKLGPVPTTLTKRFY